jgi:hypothetical protein
MLTDNSSTETIAAGRILAFFDTMKIRPFSSHLKGTAFRGETDLVKVFLHFFGDFGGYTLFGNPARLPKVVGWDTRSTLCPIDSAVLLKVLIWSRTVAARL